MFPPCSIVVVTVKRLQSLWTPTADFPPLIITRTQILFNSRTIESTLIIKYKWAFERLLWLQKKCAVELFRQVVQLDPLIFVRLNGLLVRFLLLMLRQSVTSSEPIRRQSWSPPSLFSEENVHLFGKRLTATDLRFFAQRKKNLNGPIAGYSNFSISASVPVHASIWYTNC